MRRASNLIFTMLMIFANVVLADLSENSIVDFDSMERDSAISGGPITQAKVFPQADGDYLLVATGAGWGNKCCMISTSVAAANGYQSLEELLGVLNNQTNLVVMCRQEAAPSLLCSKSAVQLSISKLK